MTPGEYAMAMFKSLHRLICSCPEVVTCLHAGSIEIHFRHKQLPGARAILFPDGTYKIDGEIQPEMEKPQP